MLATRAGRRMGNAYSTTSRRNGSNFGSFVMGLLEPDVSSEQAAVIAEAIGQLKHGLSWAEKSEEDTLRR